MPEVAFALVLNLHQPAGNLEDLLGQREWEAREILWAMDRIPRSLWTYEDIGRVHLSLSGTLLETLASPGFQRRVYGIVDCGSLLWYLQNTKIIRILGTGYYHPVLPLIPRADWDEQLERWQGIGQHLFARTSFPGFWPPEMGFCMELIPALKRQRLPLRPRRQRARRSRSPPWAGTSCATARTSPGSAARKSSSWCGTGSCPTPRRQGWTRAGSCTRWPSGPGTATSRRWSPPAPTGRTAAGSATPHRKPTSGTSSTRTCCSGHGTTEASGIRPCFIEDYLDRHGAHGEVTVRPGAWNTGWHDGSGFTQWIGSPAQQQALTRLDEISQAIYAARRNAVGIWSPRPRACTGCSRKPTGGSCGPRPAATSSGGTPGCNAATTTSTRPLTSWTRQDRA